MRQVSTTDSTAIGRPEKCTARSRKASLASTLIGRGRFRDRSLPGESVRPALTAAPVFVSSGPAPPLCPRKDRRAAFLAGARPPVPVATASPFLQTSQPACPTLRSAPPAPPLSLRPGAPAACAAPLPPPSPAAPVVRRRCHRTAPNNAFLPARIAPGRRPVATPRYRPLSPVQEA